ncbi:MAG: hypothetical protein Q9162_007438 [Coniocarpon cinnabarinum]
MEHLLFNPSQEELDLESHRLLKLNELDCDWSDANGVKQEAASLQHKWLGYEHDTRPKEESWNSFFEYPAQRGFQCTQPQLAQLDVFRFEESIQKAKDKAPEDSPFVCMMQSWLTFGLLEALLGKRIKTNYLTRKRDAGHVVIDTRNLTYVLYAEMKKAEILGKEERQRLAVQINTILSEHQWTFLCLETYMKDLEKHAVDGAASFDRPRCSVEAVQNAMLISAMIQEAFVNSLRGSYPGIRLHVVPSFSDPILVQEQALLGQTGMCPYFIRYIEPQSYTLILWLVWFAMTTGFCRLEDHSLCCYDHCALDEIEYTGAQHEVRFPGLLRIGSGSEQEPLKQTCEVLTRNIMYVV